MPKPPPDASPGQLVDVWLDRVAFVRNDEFAYDHEKLTYNVEFNTDPETVDAEGSQVRLCIKIDWFHDDGGAHPFDLTIDVVGMFTWSETDVDEDFLRGWLRFNGTYLLWPYVRSYVGNITLAAGLPPLTLFTLQVPRTTAHESGDTSDMPAVSTGEGPARPPAG